MQARTLMIPFGKNKDGQMVTASEVQRGTACQCQCLVCGDQLIARQGEIIAWHFAHAAGGRSGGGGCGEGSIHRSACGYLASATGRWMKIPKSKPEGPGGLQIAHTAREAPIPGTRRRTDVLITSSAVKRMSDPGPGRPARIRLAVEIHVTNPKDEEFATDMAGVGQRCIEIDMPPQEIWHRVSKGATWKATMRGMLLQANSERSRWIYPPLPKCQGCGKEILIGSTHCWICDPRFDQCPSCGGRKKTQYPECFQCKEERNWTGSK